MPLKDKHVQVILIDQKIVTFPSYLLRPFWDISKELKTMKKTEQKEEKKKMFDIKKCYNKKFFHYLVTLEANERKNPCLSISWLSNQERIFSP